MPSASIPPHLITFLSSPQLPTEAAVDALDEWITHRRVKGDTLFEVSVGLAELEDRTPPHVARAFDRARYVTNIPQPTDLTPPTGPFPLSRSSSPQTILIHLLSSPPPSVHHSREVILEYVLGRELKLREKKSGKGGKGTLGREGFEEIAKRIEEIELGLRGGPGSPGGGLGDMDLDESRQIGLTLCLSLRMSLSYFTLQELAEQIMLLGLADAERTLVQHVRRRVQGEGRRGVGKELEYVESLTIHRRPALRPAFRSAKLRTYLPVRPAYPISLPAPSKSGCTKLLSTFIRDLDIGGPAAASMYTQNNASPGPSAFSPDREKGGYFAGRRSTGTPYSPQTASTIMSSSPRTPLSSIPPLTPSSAYSQPLPPDPKPLANYAMELISEYLTREKREYMIKSKWAKSGREQLSKDLGEIETSLCLASKNTATSHASTLIPVFLLLRRSFALPKSPLPQSITDPYIDLIPAPPDPDEVPFREPCVQTTTATLYQNPRLDDPAALEVLEELVESEREVVEGEGATKEEMISWVTGLVEQVEKRFPDGSYEAVFALVRSQIGKPRDLLPIEAEPRTPVLPVKQPSIHRRTRSSAVTPGDPSQQTRPVGSNTVPSHSRSVSMPHRRSNYDEYDEPSDSDSDSEPPALVQKAIIQPQPILIDTSTTATYKQLPPLQLLSPSETPNRDSTGGHSSVGGGSGDWWDIVSAMDHDSNTATTAPWHENPRSSMIKRSSSSNTNISAALTLPPGAEPASPPGFVGTYPDFEGLDLEKARRVDISPTPTPPRQGTPTPPRQGALRRTSLSVNGTASTLDRTNTPPRPSVLNRSTQASSERVEQTRPPPIPLNISRPSFPSPTTTSPASVPVKSKLGTFGRSMSLAINKKKDKDRSVSGGGGEKEKDGEVDKENEKQRWKGEREKGGGGGGRDVLNNPGKWNKDLVAGIMGPPVERR